MGADAADLDRVAASFRAAAATLRRSGRWPGALRRTGWTGPDADAVAGLVARAVRDAGRAADRLEDQARHLGRAARRQREASLPPAVRSVPVRDGHGDGRVVQRIGPPDATVVVVLVPGVGTDLADEARLARDATVVWRVVASASDQPGRVAVVSWLGYDPPDVVVGALDPRPADDGARALAAAVDDLRDGGARRVTVVGHSYGAVVAGRAAADGMAADALVQLGAPGWADRARRRPSGAAGPSTWWHSRTTTPSGGPAPWSAGPTARTRSGWRVACPRPATATARTWRIRCCWRRWPTSHCARHQPVRSGT